MKHAGAHAGAPSASGLVNALGKPGIKKYPRSTLCSVAAGAGTRCWGKGAKACKSGLVCFQWKRYYGACQKPEWLGTRGVARGRHHTGVYRLQDLDTSRGREGCALSTLLARRRVCAASCCAIGKRHDFKAHARPERDQMRLNALLRAVRPAERMRAVSSSSCVKRTLTKCGPCRRVAARCLHSRERHVSAR